MVMPPCYCQGDMESRFSTHHLLTPVKGFYDFWVWVGFPDPHWASDDTTLAGSRKVPNYCFPTATTDSIGRSVCVKSLTFHWFLSDITTKGKGRATLLWLSGCRSSGFLCGLHWLTWRNEWKLFLNNGLDWKYWPPLSLPWYYLSREIGIHPNSLVGCKSKLPIQPLVDGITGFFCLFSFCCFP